MVYGFKMICLYLACLAVGKVQAQIKYQGIEFQYFHKSFPLIQFPYALEHEAVVQRTEREDYTRIAQREAQKFLAIEHSEIFEGVSPIPDKVPHFVGAFVAYQKWFVLIYYWFPYPPKRERHDNFEIVVFDRQGGRQVHEVIAGAWGADRQYATIREAGKEIVIEITTLKNNQTQTYLRTLTEGGQIK